MKNVVVGKNAVLQLLLTGQKTHQLLINKSSKHDERISAIIEIAEGNNIPYRFVEQKDLDVKCRNVKHQGIIAHIPKRQFVEIEDILEYAEELEEPPFILILDGIEDPHNFGSIARTAVAAGVHGIIVPKTKQAEITPIVSKVSTGAIDQILIAKVPNIASAIETLKKQNVWVIGTDMNAETSYAEQDYEMGLALVIGNEGKGITRLVKEKCDFLIKIPISSSIDSLNAGVSAGIMIFKIKEKRDE
ncbi:MAG: 23S rRNA (guanosine(2251)-2'-O)-methyltransferase RlmB [Candidatus Margulisbacteria bacterium]|nr:23S rRNA (guanosine(2251)-2'-O)-methyltransferase RlmB [Candidatus Margulisiibacteriota bacterium]